MKTSLTDRIISICLLGTVFLFCLTPVHNGNIFWHLRNGEDILKTGSIRTHDPFTYTMHGEDWIQQEWFAEVAFAAVWKAFGEVGLVLFKGVVITISVLFCFLAARRKGAPVSIIVLFMLAWFSVCQARWIVRPHIFTALFFSLYLYLTARGTGGLLRSLLIFIPLQIIWANTHAGFVMGIFLLSLPALDQLFRRKRSGVLKTLVLPAVALLCSGIHPNGFRSLEYIPAFFSQPVFRRSIREWWSPFDPGYQPGHAFSGTALLLTVMLIVTLILIILHRKKAKVSILTGLFILSVASIFAARNIVFLSLAAVAWVSPMISRRRPPAWIPAILLAAAAAVPFIHGVPRDAGPPKEPGVHVDWNIYPVGLADFIGENPQFLKSTIFNTNEISGYLEYRFGESLPLYIDGRCLLYPGQFFEEYLILGEADSTRSLEQLRIIQRRGINLALFDWPRKNESSAWLLARLPGWVPVYWDNLTISYARSDHLGLLELPELAFRHVDPLEMTNILSSPLYLIPQSWLPELERAASPPENLGIASILASACFLRAGDIESAARYAQMLAHDDLRTSVLQALGGDSPDIFGSGQILTIQIWSLVIQHRFSEALVAAEILGDPQLTGSIRLWKSYIQNDLDSTPASVPPHIPEEFYSTCLNAGVDSPECQILLASAALTSGLSGQAGSMIYASTKDPDLVHPWALGAAGVMLALMGDDSTAADLAGRALARAVTPYTLESCGRIDLMAGRYDSAANLFNELVRIVPRYPAGRLLYAESLWQMCDLDGAYEQYAFLSRMEIQLPPVIRTRVELMNILRGYS